VIEQHVVTINLENVALKDNTENFAIAWKVWRTNEAKVRLSKIPNFKATL
jgi:hypothetical protein